MISLIRSVPVTSLTVVTIGFLLAAYSPQSDNFNIPQSFYAMMGSVGLLEASDIVLVPAAIPESADSILASEAWENIADAPSTAPGSAPTLATMEAHYHNSPYYKKVSVVAANYSWQKFLSVHDEEWRTGGEEGLKNCRDDDEAQCKAWADQGECENNPSYLTQHCPKSCNICRMALPKEERCQRHADEPPIYDTPAGISRLFERMISDPDIVSRYTPEVVSRDPWVVVFENVVTEEEGRDLFSTVEGRFEGSTVVGGMTEDGHIGRQTLRTRTSTNAWCNMYPCMRSDIHMNIQKRVADITMTDPQHMENMQILDYQIGQFYHPHHDTITDHINMMCGPRVLNAFIYFSTAGPEDGGATNFPNIEKRVVPKLGRMVVWPMMLEDDSTKVDHRTTHEAMNVTGGTGKRAGNLWIHLYDYKTADALGCTG